MRYSIEPKNMGKNLSKKYGQKSLDRAKKSTTDAIKTASKRAIKKSAEATGDLVGFLKRSPTELYSKELQNDEMEAAKKRCISPEERQQIIDELRLV